MAVVSVVTPSFRGGAYLREAIASVRAQEFEDWELVVVLDGCDEDLSDLTAVEGRLSVVRQSRRGVAVARNVAVARARGEFVAFLDDDDRMLPGRLGAQLEAIRAAGAGLCYSQFRVIDAAGAVVGPGNASEAGYLGFLEGRGNPCLSTAMVRRTVLIEVGGFNPLLGLSEDHDVLFRVARESGVVFVPEVLAEYRRHAGNVSRPISGGRERRVLLLEHLWAARARGDEAAARAAEAGLSWTLEGRAETLVRRSHEAGTRGRRLEALGYLGAAAAITPSRTARVCLRQWRRGRARAALRGRGRA